VKNLKFKKNSQHAIKIKKSPNYLQNRYFVMRIGEKMQYLSQLRDLTIYFDIE
jgi:hypothetical protein